MSLTAFMGRCPLCGHDHGENSLFDVARGTLTPAQQAQVNEQFANYAKQKPHLYGGFDEITTLREQVKKNRKDAERWRMELRGRTNPEQHTASIDAAISAMQEGKP